MHQAIHRALQTLRDYRQGEETDQDMAYALALRLEDLIWALVGQGVDVDAQWRAYVRDTTPEVQDA